MRKNLTAFAVLAVVSGIAPAAVAETALDFAPHVPHRAGELPAYTQNVFYARQQTGVELYGDAYTWWGQAAGRYDRGRVPREKAVLALRPQSNLRMGHVAAVSRVIDSRTILLRHANWSPIDGRRGQVENDVRAVDVSPNNDWSAVRVWYGPSQDLGQTVWPAYGFIYPGKTAARAPAPRPVTPQQPAQPAVMPRQNLASATVPARQAAAATRTAAPVSAPVRAQTGSQGSAAALIRAQAGAPVQTRSNLRTLARAPESAVQQQRPAANLPKRPSPAAPVAQVAARAQTTPVRTAAAAPVRAQPQRQAQPAARQASAPARAPATASAAPRRDVIGDLIRANR